MSLEDMMTGTCTLKRCPYTPPDSLGTKTHDNPATVLADVPCDLQPAKGSIVWKYAQMQLAINFALYTITDLGALAGDVIVVDGKTYKVQGYSPPQAREEWPAETGLLYEPGH